jgi:hypothetical protein
VNAERRLARVRAAVDSLLDRSSGAYLPNAGEERRMVPVSMIDELLEALEEPPLAEEPFAAAVRRLPGFDGLPDDVIRRVTTTLLNYRDGLSRLHGEDQDPHARRTVAIFDALG